jgi:hypothetical protein
MEHCVTCPAPHDKSDVSYAEGESKTQRVIKSQHAADPKIRLRLAFGSPSRLAGMRDPFVVFHFSVAQTKTRRKKISNVGLVMIKVFIRAVDRSIQQRLQKLSSSLCWPVCPILLRQIRSRIDVVASV